MASFEFRIQNHSSGRAPICIYYIFQSPFLWKLLSLFAKNCSRQLGNNGPDRKLFILVGWGRSFFCLLLGPPGFNCWFSFAPVVLFDSPGISRCRSQHVVYVESSSLFHHTIYPWFHCFQWWSIDELENLHEDRTTNYMFWAISEAEGEVGNRKTSLSPPVF